MKNQDYNETIEVNVTPHEAFNQINNVTKWWTENLEGQSQKLNDEFTVRFDDVHVSTQKLVEIIPDRRIVWLVTDCQLNFVQNKHEWNGTRICFDISQLNDKTQIRFTHEGLVPKIECFNGCSTAWGHYIKESLYKLLSVGVGQPEAKN